MIKITNGSTEMVVSMGAYKDIYKPQGYNPVLIPAVNLDTPLEMPNLSEIPPDDSGDNFNTPEVEYTTESKSGVSEHTSEPEVEDLSEIPLNDMTPHQLKNYAKQLGVDIRGLNSKKAVKDKIKSAL